MITEIIDATGDGLNMLDIPFTVAVNACGKAYVTGFLSANAFEIVVESCSIFSDGFESGDTLEWSNSVP